jgi:hypothetical protein
MVKTIKIWGGNPPPQTMVNHNQKLGKNQITFREGQMIYVSEPGLYSLINGSQNFENKK